MNSSEHYGIDFLKIDKHDYENNHICDFSLAPRPHFCMGLILAGKGKFVFENEGNTEIIEVLKGDIIFVPVTSRYISYWEGKTVSSYISFHFYLSENSLISEKNNFKIQKVTLSDFEELKKDFFYAFENFNCDSEKHFAALGIFYKILSLVLPKLSQSNPTHLDARIRKAVDYINLNSEDNISVPQLAAICNLSPSHFYNKFKSETGYTPVEYRNRVLINRASKLLVCNKDLSVEEISYLLGFHSAAYFRRIFKAFTGKTPLQYRKTAVEV